MLPIYEHGESFLHQLSAGKKLLMVAFAGTALFFVDSAATLLFSAIVVMALIPAAGISAIAVYRQLIPLFWLLFFVFVAHVVFVSLSDAFVVSLRLITLFVLAILFTLTTRVTDITDAIIRILQPLGRFGFPVKQLGLMLSLTLRYIPLLYQQFLELREAQQARCCKAGTLSLMVPLLVKSLKLGDELGEALDARGYDGYEERDLR